MDIFIYDRFEVMILDCKSLQFIPNPEPWKQVIMGELGCSYSDENN
jgi:hypothetical protein